MPLAVLGSILLSLFITTAKAADKPVGASYTDFQGGLNNFYSPTKLAPNESPSLLNVMVDEEPGALVQRNGYLTCGTLPSGNTATNLYEYAKNDGSRNLIVTDNVTVYQTADCVNFSTITTGLSALALPRFATILDNLWIVNGSTWPIVWNGTTASLLDGSTASTPTGPKGKYISYWKSRVWISNTPTAPSSVFFSLLVDSAGNILNPATSTGAWTSTNQIYFNRDDGSPIYGIKPYRDNLYVFKETGISRLVFESEYNLSVAKNVSTIGSKFQESIVEMDDSLLRFVGRDGIYAFDGSSVKRLSTKITPTFYTLKQPTKNEQYKLWDSAVDFSAGSPDTNISLSLYPASVAISSYVPVSPNVSVEYGSTVGWSTSTLQAATTEYTSGFWFVSARCNITPPTVPTSKWEVYSSTGLWFSTTASTFGTPVNITGGTGMYLQVTAANADCNNGYLRSPVIDSNHKTIILIGDRVNTRNFSGQIVASDYLIAAVPSRPSSGTYTSDIQTATGLSEWKAFDSVFVSNDGSITYKIRVATSAYNLGLQTFSTIIPGAKISSTTNNVYQWQADLATNDYTKTPELTSASAGWITGDNSLSTIGGINYKSRYWVAASTIPGNAYNDMAIVESKSPLGTYTIFDLPLSAMTLWNGNLYAAIGNTAKIARVDYGSTDDGATIYSYWDSRDEIYENPIAYKTINTAVLDYSNSPANPSLNIALSPDQGDTLETRTLNISASTLPRNTKKLNYTANTSLGFRSRISNSALGIGFKIYGLHNFGKMTDFIGN